MASTLTHFLNDADVINEFAVTLAFLSKGSRRLAEACTSNEIFLQLMHTIVERTDQLPESTLKTLWNSMFRCLARIASVDDGKRYITRALQSVGVSCAPVFILIAYQREGPTTSDCHRYLL
ncbi:hypothetical protein BT69DRAFT_590927 [Atractiella rhizophila]|nr:hypothetical protein BT69DRAFT_590927 [Atractiella rhizophila]